jgi:ATP-binding cassette subfamily B protein
VAVLLLAGLPSFVAEAKFSGDAFRLFRWRSPETRMQMYLETVLAREDHAKEVKLFELGPLLLERYRAIFRKVFREDRALTIRRDSWGFVLGLVSTGAFYAAYAWIAVSAVRGQITLGQMTMYVMLFRQGQSAVSPASLRSGQTRRTTCISTLYSISTPVALGGEIGARQTRRTACARARELPIRVRRSPRYAAAHLRPGRQSPRCVGEKPRARDDHRC